MLVLTRLADQSVVIDESIVVTVVAIQPDLVRLGIRAGVNVRRGEIEPSLADVRDDPERAERMLVLTRRRHESIIIGERITVTVVDIRGEKARLGFEVPREMTLHRLETYETRPADPTE